MNCHNNLWDKNIINPKLKDGREKHVLSSSSCHVVITTIAIQAKTTSDDFFFETEVKDLPHILNKEKIELLQEPNTRHDNYSRNIMSPNFLAPAVIQSFL